MIGSHFLSQLRSINLSTDITYDNKKSKQSSRLPVLNSKCRARMGESTQITQISLKILAQFSPYKRKITKCEVISTDQEIYKLVKYLHTKINIA